MTSPATADRRPVAAVVVDGPEAAAVARCAARLAAAEDRPVLLLVPMLRSAFTADAVPAQREHRRAAAEARAVAARALPALDAAGVPWRVQVVWHRGWPSGAGPCVRRIALGHAARAAGARVVVAPAALPVPATPHGPDTVLVAGTGGSPVLVRRPAGARKVLEL